MCRGLLSTYRPSVHLPMQRGKATGTSRWGSLMEASGIPRTPAQQAREFVFVSKTRSLKLGTGRPCAG